MECFRAPLFSVLHVIAFLHTLHAEIYYEGENEATISRRCHPEMSSCFPSQLEWARLKAKMTGTLIWPDNSFNYTTYNYMSNLRFRSFPIVHVVCKTVADIQNAVRFAKKHNLRVTIKSTGLEVWGRSSAHDSFSINLMEMKHIRVNTATTERSEYGEVTVQTGATFEKIYAEVEKHNRIVVGGNSNGHGPGGFIAGGGMGPLTPSFGLALDNVLEIKVVLADGSVATCTQNKTVIENNGTSETRNNGDLFWALRGGGGGTFGVVVRYVLKLHPAPTYIVKAWIKVPLYQNDSDFQLATLILEKYAKWMDSAPFHWGSSMLIKSTLVIAALTKNGPLDGNEETELQPFYDLKSLYPSSTMVQFDFVNHTSIGSSIVPEPSHSRDYGAGALISAEKNNASLWNFLVNEMVENDNGYCFLSRLGDHEISTFERQEGQNISIAQFAENVRRFGDGEYINNAYVPSPGWKDDFWGENYEDLLEVKIRYDPDNLFYCYHCVGSELKLTGEEIKSSGAPANVAECCSVLMFLSLAIFM